MRPGRKIRRTESSINLSEAAHNDLIFKDIFTSLNGRQTTSVALWRNPRWNGMTSPIRAGQAKARSAAVLGARIRARFALAFLAVSDRRPIVGHDVASVGTI
jgi:hypothetical protein